MRNNAKLALVKLLVALAVSASVGVPAMPSGSAASAGEVLILSGTITQNRPVIGCTHNATGQVIATFVDGNLATLDARTPDGFTLVTAAGQGVFQTIVGWCSSGGTGTITGITHSCSGSSLSFSFASVGSTISFTTSSGTCADNVNLVFGPKLNPTDVSLVLPDLVNQPLVGCVGLVTLTLSNGAIVTLPSFGLTCSESDLCAPFVGKPGVVSCVVAPFPPPQPVTRPDVTFVDQACMWDRFVGIDINGDGTAEFGVPSKALDSSPCP